MGVAFVCVTALGGVVACGGEVSAPGGGGAASSMGGGTVTASGWAPSGLPT
jgi:hypothetical protein